MMPFPILDYKDTIATSLSSSSTDTSEHPSRLRRFKRSDKLWVSSNIETQGYARHRLLAQELFRLMLPHQPETRVVFNPNNGGYYVLTEYIPGFNALPAINDGSEEWTQGEYKRYRDDFKTGAHLSSTDSDCYDETNHVMTGYSYSDLGSSLILSVLLNNLDVSSPGVLGIDSKRRVVLSNAGMCFPGILDSELDNLPKSITPALLKALPIPDGYFARDWLDYITDGRVTGYNWNETTYAALLNNTKTLSNEPRFREEMNRTMLKIIVIPDWFFASFCAQFIPIKSEQYKDFICKRRDELMHSALQNRSFQAYLSTPQATKVVRDLLNQVKAFKAGGDSAPSFVKDIGRLSKDLNHTFYGLKQRSFADTVTCDGITQRLNWPKIEASVFINMVEQRFTGATPDQKMALDLFYASLSGGDYSVSGESSSNSSLDSSFPASVISDPYNLFQMVFKLDPSGDLFSKSVISTYIRNIDDPFRIIALGILAEMLQQDLNSVIMVWSDSYFDNETPADRSYNEKGYTVHGAYFDLFQPKWDRPIDLLLKVNADDNNNLMLAIAHEPRAISPFLAVMKQASPSQRAALLTRANVFGYTALTLAIVHHLPDRAEELLDAVTSLDHKDILAIVNETTINGDEDAFALAKKYCPTLASPLNRLALMAHAASQETNLVHHLRKHDRQVFFSAMEPGAKKQRGRTTDSAQDVSLEHNALIAP